MSSPVPQSFSKAPAPGLQACRVRLSGHVQGVGFRPFVYRLATKYGLSGWVQNQLGQVETLVQGRPEALDGFLTDLIRFAPPLSRPEILSKEPVAAQAVQDFSIIASSAEAQPRIFVPPDYYTCEDCLRELLDPHDRRFRYPFINCTQCGPRYTLIEGMPYDRPNTTMSEFQLCSACEAEYTNPQDRRFHAEPVACAQCGPRLEFCAHGAEPICDTEAALAAASKRLIDGGIVAVKGVGGYHLMCDARSGEAVSRLRVKKKRPDKPLAVMFPAADALGLIEQEVSLTPEEIELLCSPMRPIVLGRKKQGGTLADEIAPGLGEIGVFLPYSPLHHLLLNDIGGPLVATSGNLSGEPVLTEKEEAQARLGGIADAFLHHDRPIARPADDPVYRTSAKRPLPLRLGRGCAPLELTLPAAQPEPMLAVGAHMKNTIALSWDDRVVVSPHIGEMDTPRSLDVFEAAVEDLQNLYGIRAQAVVCDAHPGYTTTRWARRSGLAVHSVFHHHAHASALAGEHGIDDNWVMFTWDGVGYGEDGSLWGGETLLGKPGSWRRVGTIRPFHLPGGDKAGREPWRSAASLCWETGRDWAGAPAESLLHQAWRERLNCPKTSAVGRVFDAAAAMVMNVRAVSYEGQGPMMLEAVCDGKGEVTPLPLRKTDEGLWQTDWEPLLAQLLDHDIAVAQRSADFHSSLAQGIVDQAERQRSEQGVTQVGLCGGVFQNRILARQATSLLESAGFTVALAEQIPCNDAGISYGQAVHYACVARNTC